jgi:hypothetical protein
LISLLTTAVAIPLIPHGFFTTKDGFISPVLMIIISSSNWPGQKLVYLG